ncbi:tachylectin-related carbohydrate-binding protein [Micromonospora sp. WMMD812]|uniref:trypsin-like serine protease n=1 Tax=Micromonospora sp. WMMD812 TaxID=3015152 RepID=UPI00248AFD9D|nr:tachylectin-related carbohydrate-binding protein [Micromonospora sp. WMMD812]WBB70811.1 trypsin-like serine protease [Micromonospora sp. WMMD812]
MSARRARRWGAALVGATLAAGLLGGGSASAIAAADPVPDGTYRFSSKITFGDLRSCSGALVDQNWLLTTRSCFAVDTPPTAPGAPARPTTAVVGRTDLTGTAGQQRTVTHVVPHPGRNLALARLSAPVTDVPPVALSTTAPTATETLTVTGYGRTSTEWVPDRLHRGSFTVQEVTGGSIGLLGASAGATLCKGDAGGPAFRDNAGTVELVAVAASSWQKGCLGETETRDGATATRVDDLGAWVREQLADVQIFGVNSDNRLTYGVIDSVTGDLRANRTSTAALSFTPKAMATLNADTILMNDAAGNLYRIDVTGNDPLTFTATDIADGWSAYNRLTYDGYGSLYYINGTSNQLYRRTITSAKPTGADLTWATAIDTGFSQKTITSPAAGRILGTTSDGRLLSYRVYGNATTGVGWTVSPLATTGWAGPTQVVSPGGGLYYARTATGRLDRYRDANPVDGSGADLQSFPTDPVSTSGWNQVLLSARPWAGLVSVFGTKADGRLSYTAFDPVTGLKRVATVSQQTLGFTPKAMATLNSDTLLVTSTASQVYRVDVTSFDPLVFTRTESLAGGWTHDRLVYDGNGALFGTAGGFLRRYKVNKAKPVAADLPGWPVYNGDGTPADGFSLPTLGATGRNQLIATAGTNLVQYEIDASNIWRRTNLVTTGWSGYTSLLSPGGGHYYRRDANGVLTGWLDRTPYDRNGSDVAAYVPAGTVSGGWDPILSARPYDSWPDSTRRW